MPQPKVVEIAAYLPDDAAAAAFWVLMVSALGNNVSAVYPGYPLAVRADREVSPTGATTRVTKFAVLLGGDGAFLSAVPGGGNGGGGGVTLATSVTWDDANQWVDIAYPEAFALGVTAYAILMTQAGAVYPLGEAVETAGVLRCSGLSETLNGIEGILYVQGATGIVLQSNGTTTAQVQPPPQS